MLRKIAIGVILNGAALYGVMYFLPEIQYTGGFLFFAIGGLTMGILNTIVKPILKLLTFPLHILTLGLSLMILNGVIFWIFETIIDTIAIDGVILNILSVKTYFFAGFLFGLINWLEHLIIHSK